MLVAETQTCGSHERVGAESQQMQLLLMFPSQETWKNFTPPRQAGWLDVQGSSATRGKASVVSYIHMYSCTRVYYIYTGMYISVDACVCMCVCISMYACLWMNSHVQMCISMCTWTALHGGFCNTRQCLHKEAQAALCMQNCAEKSLLNACAFVTGNKNTQHPVGVMKI